MLPNLSPTATVFNGHSSLAKELRGQLMKPLKSISTVAAISVASLLPVDLDTSRQVEAFQANQASCITEQLSLIGPTIENHPASLVPQNDPIVTFHETSNARGYTAEFSVQAQAPDVANAHHTLNYEIHIPKTLNTSLLLRLADKLVQRDDSRSNVTDLLVLNETGEVISQDILLNFKRAHYGDPSKVTDQDAQLAPHTLIMPYDVTSFAAEKLDLCF